MNAITEILNPISIQKFCSISFFSKTDKYYFLLEDIKIFGGFIFSSKIFLG